MNLNTLVQLKSKPLGHLLLSLLSALLFALPWMGLPVPTQLIAFVPLLIIADNCSKKWQFWCWCALTIIVWTTATTYWIVYAAVIGIFASIIATFLFFTIPILVFYTALKKSNRALAYTLFISSWVAAEYLYLWNEQISHPWLIVGNAFAVNTELVQWYEYFGALGGSLWALVTSVSVYETLRRKSRRGAVISSFIVVVPIVVSLVMYFNYKEAENPIKVTIVQPNIDPYTDKFDGMSDYEQLQLIKSLASQAPSDVDYIIAPETALNDNIDVDTPLHSGAVCELQSLMRERYPDAECVIGATMFKIYPPSPNAPNLTARVMRGGNGYYDVINGSLQIDTSSRVETYNKSRLVIGVEMLPFPEVSKYISAMSVDLGGASGALLPQKDKEVFVKYKTGEQPVAVSANICYESIYGEFMGGFARNGAQVFFVITNDGWWRDTFGYQQHFIYSRLRAIENRRSVARSANTGISGIINQRGDVVQELGWQQRGVITGDINLNSKKTFYTVFGDLIGRIALYTFLISLLYFIAYIYKKKSHLNK